MKKGLIALLVIVLVIVLIAIISMARPPTGYAISGEMQSQIDAILREGKSATVSAEEVVAVQTVTQDQQEKIAAKITELQRESAGNALTRYVRSLSPFRNKLDCDGDGARTIGDAICFSGERNNKAVELVFRELYLGREPDRYDLSLLLTSGSDSLEFVPLQTNTTNSTNSSGGGALVGVCSTTFVRGNANNDALIDLGDIIYSLNFLFQAGSAPSCGDIMDSNDDNVLDISDPVYTLAYLFGGGPQPFAPFPSTGYDEQGRGAGTGPVWNYCDTLNNDADGATDEGEGCIGNETHLACVGLSCMPVAGGGPNLCTSNLDCMNSTNSSGGGGGGGGGSNTTNVTHLECVGQTCMLVAGAGPNLCTSSAQCVTNVTNGTLPDLRILSITHNLTNSTNASIVTVTGVVINSGTGNAGASTTQYIFGASGCSGGGSCGGGAGSQSISTPALSAGQQTTITRTHTANPGSTVSLSFRADSTFVIAESNELNNLLNYTFLVP